MWWFLGGAGVIALVMAFVAQRAWRRDRRVARDIEQLVDDARRASGPVTVQGGRSEDGTEPIYLSGRPVAAGDIAALPAPVQRWMKAAGVLGKPVVHVCRLHQRGRIRTAPGKSWMPFEANQIYTAEPPGFVWDARVRVGPGVWLSGEDVLKGGHGETHVELLSAFRILDADGYTMDQGSMTRFLSEIVWFPSAALAPCVQWDTIDDRAARATLRESGRSVSGVFRFDDEGLVASFECIRYHADEVGGALEPWSAPVSSYTQFDGVRVPKRGRAVWHLEDGDFAYVDIQDVSDLHYEA